jgi:hypothetical protein
MLSIPRDFSHFQQCWRALPRQVHPLLPRKRDITPALFGELLHQMCIGERENSNQLQLLFAGTGFERNAGFAAMGANYYEAVPKPFVSAIRRFHDNLFTTPCAAYVSDHVTSTTGTHYLHHTLHLPATDDTGEPRYLIVFGLDRKPASDIGSRSQGSVGESSIKELAYLDLGAGAPSGYISDFVSRHGKAQITTTHNLRPPGAAGHGHAPVACHQPPFRKQA